MGGVSLSSMPIGLFIYSSFSRPLGILDVPDKTFIRSLYGMSLVEKILDFGSPQILDNLTISIPRFLPSFH